MLELALGNGEHMQRGVFSYVGEVNMTVDPDHEWWMEETAICSSVPPVYNATRAQGSICNALAVTESTNAKIWVMFAKAETPLFNSAAFWH